MRQRQPNWGAANTSLILVIGSLAILAVLITLLLRIDSSRPASATADGRSGPATSSDPLFVYCAAGMRYPLEEIAAAYHQEYGVPVQLQYGGSNTLLGQLEVSRTGDLYLAADASYTELAHRRGLVKERLPLARMRPVIVVSQDNPKNVQGLADLIDGEVRYALGDPDATAIGKNTRSLLAASGGWEKLKQQAAVFKPTVNDVANAVKIGSVDAGIVWDATANQYPELTAIHDATLNQGTATIEIAVTDFARDPTAALHFARYVAAADKGLTSFATKGFETLAGDQWADHPEMIFFVGAVNRRAIDPAIREFEHREGVTVNTIYNGCGILTAQMRSMRENQQDGFPDTYMACDVYYLDTVNELFQEGINISETDIVLVVPKGNPKNIRTLGDLARRGVRVAMGQPRQCTIGVLSRRLLASEGLYETLKKNGNVVTETTSSALLVPNITTGAADVVLAYRSDTEAEKDRLTVIDIDSSLAKAIQPFSIAKTSNFKYLGRRLFATIAASREDFLAAGFNWRLGDSPGVPNKKNPIHELPGN
jgi:molybdate transport system substrate-binding protein